MNKDSVTDRIEEDRENNSDRTKDREITQIELKNT